MSSACSTGEVCQGSAGAASCGCPAAAGTPTENAGCVLGTDAPTCSAAGDSILTCTQRGTCGVWIATSCGALVCSTANGAPACVCPANTTSTFYVDSIHSTDPLPDAGGIQPTGVDQPVTCRFGTLTHALTVADALGTAASVIATGAADGQTMIFASDAGTGLNSEVFPLNVASGVSLNGDTRTDGGYTIVVDAATTAGVSVAAAASGSSTASDIGNLSILVTPAAGTCDGIDVSGSATLHDLSVTTETQSPANGIALLPSATAQITKLMESGFGHGIDDQATGTTAVANSLIVNNAIGIDALAGTISTDSTSVNDSQTVGVRISNTAVELGAGTEISFTGEGTSTTVSGVQLKSGSLSIAGTAASPVSIHDNNGNGVDVEGGTFSSTNATFKGNFNPAGNFGTSAAVLLNLAAGSPTATLGAGNAFDTDRIGVLAGNASVVQIAAGNGFNNERYGIQAKDLAQLTATSPTITGAFPATTGVYVGGGTPTVTLHGGTYSQNPRVGIDVAAGTLNLDSSPSITSNGIGLLIEGSGTAVVGNVNDATDIADIGTSSSAGIKVTSLATSSFYDANIHDTASGPGIDIAYARSNTAVTTFQGCTVTRNPVGVRVEQTFANVILKSSFGLLMRDNLVTANTGDGIDIGAANQNTQTGPVIADFDGNTISSNDGVGVQMKAGSYAASVSFSANTVTGNGSSPSAPISATGLYFASGGLTSFQANDVHGNAANQIYFGNNGGPCGATTYQWDISASDCTGSQNKVHGYSGSGTGHVGVEVGPASCVNGNDVSWEDTSPTINIDYQLDSNGGSFASLTHTSSCPETSP